MRAASVDTHEAEFDFSMSQAEFNAEMASRALHELASGPRVVVAAFRLVHLRTMKTIASICHVR